MFANVVLPSYSNKYIQNIGKEWTCVNCSTPNKNKVKLVLGEHYKSDCAPLEEKKGKNGKCIPKCWEFFGF